MKKRLAFTLSELLMVVAILALLLGMLLPSLVNALEFPRRTACLNNLRQMGQALSGYQGSNNGYMPPFAGHAYDWIWPDSLSPYISGKPCAPKVESGFHIPGRSIWACPDANHSPLLRTNYANTCGTADSGGWHPSDNNAGLVMTDAHGTGHQITTYDSYTICNRYSKMDSRSILLYCGNFGCNADPGFPDPSSLPDDWNRSRGGTVAPLIHIPFGHLNQNPALSVNGSAKSYNKGTRMGGVLSDGTGNSSETWVPMGN
jgi:type II secretory pathway pseudopilin PulG